MKIYTFSFDDGTIQDKKLTEIFNKYGIRATFNINSGFFGQQHRILHAGIDVDHTEISREEAPSVYKGHEIAVHTKTHPDLRTLNENGIIDEVAGDKEELEKVFGCKIKGMAYPGGGKPYNDNVIKTIINNTDIRYARTILSHHRFEIPTDFMQWHPTCDVNDFTALDLADELMKADTDEDMLFYVWGHSFEFDKFKSWETIEKLCEKLSSCNELVNMTNGEVYEKFK